MRVSDLTKMSLVESSFYCDSVPILEDGEGPRLKFNYDRWKHDPKPDILLLGTYKHPSTGNELVGGVNLHYITPQQRDALSRSLPTIMQGNNLYYRYHIGKRLNPDIFNDFYRTYDSKYVRGVQRDIMYPKYGYVKTAANWVKKKLGDVFKSKAQRQKELEPKYPEDIESIQDRLDKMVAKLQVQSKAGATQAQKSEIQTARDEYAKIQQQQNPTDNQLDQAENIPMNQALHDKWEIDNPVQMPTEPQVKLPDAQLARQTELARKAEMAKQFEREKLQNQRELEIDTDELHEQITYYSPIRKRWITESITIGA